MSYPLLIRNFINDEEVIKDLNDEKYVDVLMHMNSWMFSDDKVRELMIMFEQAGIPIKAEHIWKYIEYEFQTIKEQVDLDPNFKQDYTTPDGSFIYIGRCLDDLYIHLGGYSINHVKNLVNEGKIKLPKSWSKEDLIWNK